MIPIVQSKFLTARWGFVVFLSLVLACFAAGAPPVFASPSSCLPVPAPQLISPADGAEVWYTWQDGNYFLNWEALPGVPSYHLRIWNADTEELVVDEQIEGEGSDSFEIWGMAGSFTWNVIAMNPEIGCSPSPPSETWAFTAAQRPPPAVPVNVYATDGTYRDRIIVTWEQPPSESILEQWQVWRSIQPDPQTAVEVSNQGDTFIDKDVIPGVIYYYWVEACSHSDGCSELSAPDSGYADQVLLKPVNVRATDGVFGNRIEIDWDLPTLGPPVDHWLVFRSTQPDLAQAEQVDYSTNTHSISEEVTPGVTYYFWVQACSEDNNCSEMSEPDSGFAKIPTPPPAPVDVQATDGAYINLIEINWAQPDSEDYIDHFLVYRSTQPDYETAEEVDYSTNTRSLSDGVTPGVTYYFWIRACTDYDLCSEPSEPDSGYAGALPVVLDNFLYFPYVLR